MCRCFGNFLVDNYSFAPDIRKQKLIAFAGKTSNYVDEVSKSLKHLAKEDARKRKDKIRTYLSIRVRPMIDALCGTDMDRDLKNIIYKKN